MANNNSYSAEGSPKNKQQQLNQLHTSKHMVLHQLFVQCRLYRFLMRLEV